MRKYARYAESNNLQMILNGGGKPTTMSKLNLQKRENF